MFIALFAAAPVLSQIDHTALVPYLHGKENAAQAIKAAEGPLKNWMLRPA